MSTEKFQFELRDSKFELKRVNLISESVNCN